MPSPSGNPKQLTRFEKFAQEVELGPAPSKAFLANPQMVHLRQLLTRPVGTVQAGAAILFAGSDRDAKITAATALASELRLSLFRVDLTAVVSKFIGETEKNLAAIFNSTEASSAILFFDEADTLFGERSEVKDSHDRFANVEISFLLQRIEQSHVIAILATNVIPTWPPDWLRHVQSALHFPPLP